MRSSGPCSALNHPSVVGGSIGKVVGREWRLSLLNSYTYLELSEDFWQASLERFVLYAL